jgi:hypothetical protein
VANKFPALILDVGRYPVEWSWAGELMAGEFEVSARQPPRVQIYGEPKDRLRLKARSLPDPVKLDYLEGQLRTGHDVVVCEPDLETWFPGQTKGLGRFALVGLAIRDVDGQRYSRARLQVTGLPMLMDQAPLSEIRMPQDVTSWEGKEFSIKATDSPSLEWSTDGLTISCGYDSQLSGMDAYRFQMVFAPVIDLASDNPLAISEWIEQWVIPLYQLVSFATKKAQKMSWVTFVQDTEVGDPQSRRRAQLFGSGIEQDPYLAERPELWDKDKQPVFTFQSLGEMGLPNTIRRWHELLVEGAAFLDLFSAVLFTPDLPERAKYLYLVQALETLHASEHADRDAAAQTEYQQQRDDLLSRVKARIDPGDLRLLRRKWSKRRPESLTYRLDELFKGVGSEVREVLAELASSGTGSRLREAGAISETDMLRVLRNELSHGVAVYSGSDLRGWVQLLERIARVHLARLLGLSNPDAVT